MPVATGPTVLQFSTSVLGASAVLSRRPQSHYHVLAPDIFALW
ncbi:unnamed protein product, partial [Ascophyllum nodosum]